MALLETRDLCKSYITAYRDSMVINHVNLQIQKGEFIAIHGESGSGKTTLLNLLAGFLEPTGGDVYINNECITKMSESQKAMFRRKNVGFIFQSYNLLPELTVVENVMLPLLIDGVKKEMAHEAAEKALSYVGLSQYFGNTPEKLSGGQNQRVAIARAIVTNPLLIFADEPTGNLDSRNKKEVMKLLKKINGDNETTILMVTHSLQDQSYAERTIQVKDGGVK
ncbi:MAG: ABC transporter ATP-binding protein [Eubacteriales bacterium]|nr:ABC transporter ATP-binding protein [Eubacteriales bacterium]